MFAVTCDRESYQPAVFDRLCDSISGVCIHGFDGGEALAISTSLQLQPREGIEIAEGLNQSFKSFS